MQSLLIIDDDAHMLTSLTDVLSQAGYDVSGAASGFEALEVAQTRRPDLVISDVRMAGMDGIECIGKLRETRPDLKSIVITGYASIETPGRAMDVATCDYLCKPFTADQLIQSVSRALFVPNNGGLAGDMQDSLRALSALEAVRQRTLQNFYLGIRSTHLGATAALAVWDHLESAEVQRLEFEKNLQLRLEAPALQEVYATISSYCKNPSDPVIAGHKRKPGGASRIAFQPFFNNIRHGFVSSEQLKKAADVRQRIQDTTTPSPIDYDLYSLIWLAKTVVNSDN